MSEDLQNINLLPATNQQDSVFSGSEGGSADTPLLVYQSKKEVGTYIDRLKALHTSLKKTDALPTQIIFPEQNEQALGLTAKYVHTIRSLVDLLMKHGLTKQFDSYSYRVAHFQHLNEWLNIVVRLQFATALNAVRNTLNEALDSDDPFQWGVLEIDDKGIYSIDGQELTFGEKVDIFTTSEKVVSGVIFDSHESLNCKAYGEDTLPVVHYETSELKNLDYDSIQKRYDSAISEKEHLLGVDAWSFFNVLLYKKHLPESNPIELCNNLLSMQDRDPSLTSFQYEKDIEFIRDLNLPFGVEQLLIPAVQSYFCKKKDRHDELMDSIRLMKTNEKDFRKKVKAGVGDAVLLGFADLLQYLAGQRSKLVKLRLVLASGEVVDVATTDRQFTMEKLHIFNRYNISQVLFTGIKFKAKKKGKIKEDHFELTDRMIKDTDVVAVIMSEAKFYYFDETATEDNDQHFAMYMKLRRDYKAIAKMEKGV